MQKHIERERERGRDAKEFEIKTHAYIIQQWSLLTIFDYAK